MGRHDRRGGGAYPVHVPRLLRPVDLSRLPVGEAVSLLRRALDGEGDALLPGPDGQPADPGLAPGTALRPGEDDADDPTAVVLSTSGSTGPAKGALLQRSALTASATATHERLGGAGTWLLALTPHHVAGVQVLVRSSLAGTEPEVLDLADGFTADGFVRATQRLQARAGGPAYTALVPTQLLRLLDAGPVAAQALSSYDGVLVGAAATPDRLLARAHDAGARVVTTYGMSETAGGCVYDGTPLTGVRTAVGEDGRVLLGGAVVARGYRLKPAAPQFTVAEGTRWFATSDLGVLREGRLQVTGRADDVIVTGGLKVEPALVEAVLTSLDPVAEAVVVGVPDEQWGQVVVAVVVAADPLRAPSLPDLRSAVTERLGSAAAPRRLVLVDALPMRGPGKPDRAAAAALAAGTAAGTAAG